MGAAELLSEGKRPLMHLELKQFHFTGEKRKCNSYCLWHLKQHTLKVETFDKLLN
jgi:hypothetical protein